MIAAQPNGVVLATQAGLPTGLVGQLIVAVLTDVGAFVTSWTTDGITETPAGSGAYLAELQAPTGEGEYVIAWDRTAVGLDPIRTEGLLVTLEAPPGGGPPPEMTPDLADVEALLRARTVVDGEQTGTFSADSRPTADQVVELIGQAVTDVAGRVGVTVPANLVGLARELAALRASQLVEAGYFPEQTREDDTVYQQHLASWNTGIVELINGARKAAAAGTVLA